MSTLQHIVVLGAGPAGLAAASQLGRRGLAEVTVVDRSDNVGGLAGSFEVSGVMVDFGSHRLHRECSPDILADLHELLGEDLTLRPRRGRIRLGERWLAFPLSAPDLLRNLPPRLATAMGRDLARRFVHGRGALGDSFAEVMQHGVGPALCEAFYFPYARKVWGLDPTQLSPVQALRRVAARSSLSLVRKAISSAPLVGERQSRGFYYPRHGYGQISKRLAEDAQQRGARIVLGASIEEVRFDGQATVVVRTGDTTEEIACDRVWSTIPMRALTERICPSAPNDVLEAARSLHSRAMVLAYVTLAADRFSEFDTHYFPQDNVPFSRVSEPKNFSGPDAPGRTVLCVEIPTDVGSPLWDASDAEVQDVVLDGLSRADLPVAAAVVGTTVVRLPAAYPVYAKGFEHAFDTVDRWLEGFDSLLTFGRQGLFAHNNLHHVLETAYAAADCLSADGFFDRGQWVGFRTAFDRQVVVD